MAQVRIDLTGDANSLVTQIGQVTSSIRELQRSAADVYAMRGDAGMVGLQRQIQAATNDLNLLKDQLLQLGRADVSGAVNQIQEFDRGIKSAAASARAFKGDLGTMASLDDVARQQAALAAIQADKKRYYDQETAQMAAQAAAQKKALQDQSKDLAAFYKQQETLQKDQINFSQKVAPSSPINQQLVEQKRQYDAATDAAERLGQTERRVQAQALAAAKAHQAERDAIREKIAVAEQYAAGSRVDLGGYDAKKKTFETFAGGRGGGGGPDPGAANAWDGLSHSIRHVIALFDEFQRGQRGAMTASIGALLRDQAAINGLIAALATPWGVVAAAGIAAAAAIGFAFEQEFQKIKSVNEQAISVALKGGGASPSQYKGYQEEFDRLKASTNELAGNVRELQKELDKLPLAGQGAARSLLGDMSKGLAATTGGDLGKSIEPLVTAANKGAEALIELAEKQYGIQNATDGTNRTFRQQISTLGSLDQQIIATFSAIKNVHDATLEHNTAVRAVSNSWWEWATRGALLLTTVTTGGSALHLLNSRLREQYQSQKDVNEAATQGSEAQRTLNAAVEAANDGLTKQSAIVANLAVLWNNAATSVEQAIALQNAIAKVDKMGGSEGEQNRHRIAMDNIDAEAQKRQADLGAQLKAEQDRLKEIANTQTQKRVEAGADPTKAAIDATSSEEYIKQQQKVEEAQRRIADERVQLEIDAQRAIINNEQIGTAARIAAQQKIIELTKQEVDAGRKKTTELAAEEIKLAGLKRQENTKSFQEARDNARAEVELAKGNVDEIIAAYQRLHEAAVKFGMSPTVGAQIDREKIRDLESAQSKAFSAATEFNSAQERLGNLQIASEKARLGELVAQHKMSKEDMARAEGDYTAKVMEENEKRIQSELANDNLTKEQKEKLYEHLAELYEKDAELQVQAQEKATQAVEAENKRREAIFTKTFDQIGSEGEKAIEGLFDRSKTHGQVFKTFAQQAFKSIALGAAGELSEIGGQKVGPMLGLTKEESKGGIGQVLGSALFKAIGLEKEPSQDKLTLAGDKIKQAAEAQSKAVELQNEASKNLLKASEALTKAAGERGVPGNFQEGSGTGSGGGGVSRRGGGGHLPGSPTPDYTGTPQQAQEAVSYSLEATGEKLKNYCATLVNESLERAGVKGSGSGLASSFKTYGTAVDPSQVRAGDIFYSPPSGWGDTGHVGFTTGPVKDGQVPVMSSHMQGDPSNPAGPEYRNVDNLIFRRPDYAGGQSKVSLDASSSQVVASGVTNGEQQASSTVQNAVDSGVQQGNTQLLNSNEADKQSVDANKQAIDKNTTATDKNSSQLQSSGGGGGGATQASATGGSLNVLKEGANAASSGLSLLGGRFGAIGNAINRGVGAINSLSSITKTAGDGFDLLNGTTKAVTTATTLEQGAKTLNASATAVDTTAMQTNAAAASASGGGGILGGIFKFLAFSQGGILPSAAGGMMVGGPSGGTLSLLHPEEMVLPAHLSKGLQGLINGGNAAAPTGGDMTLNYNTNITGYHPYGTRSEFEGMLRNNSSAMMDHLRNEYRNGNYR